MSQSQSSARYNNTFFRSEYVGSRFMCKVPPDLPFEKVLEPAYWCHVGQMMRQWDRIEIRPDDASYIAELVVIDAGPLYAKVALHSKTVLVAQADDAAALEVELVGSKFRVKRGSDVLKDGLATKKDAQRWIEDYAGKKAA